MSFVLFEFFLLFSIILLSFIKSEQIVLFGIFELGNIFDRSQIYKIVFSSYENFFLNGVGFGRSSEDLIMKQYFKLDESFGSQILAIPSVPITIFVEAGFLGLLSYILFIPVLIHKNQNFKSYEIKSILVILIIIQLTQYFDISLFRFHPLTFFFAIYLGMSFNKNFN